MIISGYWQTPFSNLVGRSSHFCIFTSWEIFTHYELSLSIVWRKVGCFQALWLVCDNVSFYFSRLSTLIIPMQILCLQKILTPSSGCAAGVYRVHVKEKEIRNIHIKGTARVAQASKKLQIKRQVFWPSTRLPIILPAPSTPSTRG